jgi:Family of unknown function (DUF6314)
MAGLIASPARNGVSPAAIVAGAPQVQIDGQPGQAERVDDDLGHCQAEHPCRADHYRLTHVVRGADLIEERWQVSGPDKDYQAITRLRRKPLQDAPIHRTIDGNNVT